MRILYIDIDSLNPRHTGPYRYGRRTTPNLDRFAQDAVVFERCYCSDSPCLPSRAALSAQRFGIANGVIGHATHDARMRYGPGGHHPAAAPLLGKHLANHGIYTASISCFADRHLAFFFQGNFRESIKPTLSSGNDEDAANVNRVAFRWLDQHAREENWLLHLNYWDPHTDYVMPQSWFDRAAESGPPPAWPDTAAIEAHQEIYGPHSATDLHANFGGPALCPATMPDRIGCRADFWKLITGYDGAILYWDYHFGQLLDKLASLGVLHDTAIIVSADHGEAFGENGSYAEHGLANEPTHHVPMIIRWPGVTDALSPAARRCDALIYQFDLGATLCELLGFPTPPRWQSESFAAAVRGRPFAGRPHLILGHGAHTYQRAVRTRDHLYMQTLHPGCFRAEPEQLFNVAEDPHLTRDLLGSEPSLARPLQDKLSAWLAEFAEQDDPMQASRDEGPTLYNQPAAYQAFLRRSGRSHLAHDLEARLRNMPLIAR